MTAQVNDLFRYEDEEFALAGISEGTLFNPEILGIQPISASTGCYRGYQAIFGIYDAQLVLDDLLVKLSNGLDEKPKHYQIINRIRRVRDRLGLIRGEIPAPDLAINGIVPTIPDKSLTSPLVIYPEMFNCFYQELKHSLNYSGGVLIAKTFVGPYVHLGFHPAWKYEKVIELIFEGGVLREQYDRSEKMAAIREVISELGKDREPSQMPSTAEIAEWIVRS